MDQNTLIELLNEIDKAHTYTADGDLIKSTFSVMDIGEEEVNVETVDVMWRWFNYLRESLKSDVPIVIGDFIKVENLSYSGIVIGEGFLTSRKYPAWKVRGPNGEVSAIPKDQAKFIAPHWKAKISTNNQERKQDHAKRSNCKRIG